MDIIKKISEKFIQRYLNGRISKYAEIIEAARTQLYDIDNQLDKIKFLNIILEGNNKTYDRHKPNCQSPENCDVNFAHESISYFLVQELNRLGVQLNEDTFTVDEKDIADSKLDKILKDLEDLKMGHQIIYDDLLKEMNELRELYFLGKKKWHQLFTVKCIEMVTGGIISETVSKQIIESLGPTLTKFIEIQQPS